MKEFVFVSDFDNTMTYNNFYRIVIDKYLGDFGKELFLDWKHKDISDINFLGIVLKSINKTEDEILQDIWSIPFDETVVDVINKVKSVGGDFVILSAGTSYYIDRFLSHNSIENIKVISNKGEFRDLGIQLIPDFKSKYYSDIYGIDKFKVVKDLKNKYKKIYYAGDSSPDLKASILANQIFAKGELKKLLQTINHKFVAFSKFSEILPYIDW